MASTMPFGVTWARRLDPQRLKQFWMSDWDPEFQILGNFGMLLREPRESFPNVGLGDPG